VTDKRRIYDRGPAPSVPTKPTVTVGDTELYDVATMSDALRRIHSRLEPFATPRSDFEKWLLECGYDSGSLTPFRTGAQAFVEYLRRSSV
jgi:hypothetical protein